MMYSPWVMGKKSLKGLGNIRAIETKGKQAKKKVPAKPFHFAPFVRDYNDH